MRPYDWEMEQWDDWPVGPVCDREAAMGLVDTFMLQNALDVATRFVLADDWVGLWDFRDEVEAELESDAAVAVVRAEIMALAEEGLE